MDSKLHRFLSVTFSRDFADIAARNAVARRSRETRTVVVRPGLYRLAPFAPTIGPSAWPTIGRSA